jgi:hypothetical protein
MNSLHRNLKPGDRIVLHTTGQMVEVAYLTLGCYDVTQSTDIAVRRRWRTQVTVVSGLDINAEATLQKCAKRNGWDLATATAAARTLLIDERRQLAVSKCRRN